MDSKFLSKIYNIYFIFKILYPFEKQFSTEKKVHIFELSSRKVFLKIIILLDDKNILKEIKMPFLFFPGSYSRLL